MTAKTKSRATPAAQSREETEAAIARIGVAQRALQRLDADLGDRVAKAKEQIEGRAQPLKEQIAADQALVQGWCEAHRAAITRDGAVKFGSFATGEVKWRLRPPKVSIRNVEGVVAYLQERFQGRFLRSKVEVDKEALLADRMTAALVPGVSIGSEGEDFVVEPFDAGLSPGVAGEHGAAPVSVAA